MTTYSTVEDIEVQVDAPARASTWVKFRDNVLAIAEGDETEPTTPKIDPAAFRKPQDGAVRICDYEWTISATSTAGEQNLIFAQFTFVAAGNYRIAGSLLTSQRVKLLLSGSLIFNSIVSSFSELFAAVNGDKLLVYANPFSSMTTVTIEDLRLVADHIPPIGQNRFFVPPLILSSGTLP